VLVPCDGTTRRPRLSGARAQPSACALVARAPGDSLTRLRAVARGVAAGAQPQPQARLTRAGQVVAPARARQARSRARTHPVLGTSRHQGALCCMRGESRAHSVHQQPTGRSAGVCRRRSSRLASDIASAAMRGATSASKCAMVAAVVRGSSVLSCRASAASLASDSSSLPCAGGKTELLGPLACQVQAACSRTIGRHAQGSFDPTGPVSDSLASCLECAASLAASLPACACAGDGNMRMARACQRRGA